MASSLAMGYKLCGPDNKDFEARCNGIDDQGKDAEAPFSPIAPHEPNDRLLQHIRGQISNAPRLPHAPVKALDLI